MSDRTPPHDLPAEASVIGGMLLDPCCVPVAARILTADRFFRPAHQRLFSAIVGMTRAGKPVDLVTLNDELTRLGWLEGVGGIRYVETLVDGTPGASNMEYYAGIVLDAAGKRDMIALANEIAIAGYDKGTTAKDALALAAKRVYSLHDSTRPGDRPVSILEAADEALAGDAPPAVKTGFTDLDYRTGGLQADDYAILAGPTGSGKTSLAICLCANVAAQGKRVLYVTLEMHHRRIANRLLSALSGIPSNCIRDRRLSETDRQRLAETRHLIAGWGIQLERPDTVAEIAGSARAMKGRGGLDLIIVDHIQLLTGEGTSRYDEFTRISRDLKMLTASLQIPIIALAQLRRPPEQGKATWRPHKGALKESGGLENDADHIWLLWRPSEEDPIPDQPNEVWLKIDKQRDGMVCGWPDQTRHGIVFGWTPSLTRFETMTQTGA